MKDKLEELATILKGMNFYAHQAHNLIQADTFMQDHSFLGDLYEKYDDDYDDVVERSIGLGEAVDIAKVNKDAAEIMDSETKMEPNEAIGMLLVYEQTLCDSVKEMMSGASPGTQQLIGEIANQSEIRQYKMRQRLSKG